jgi:hypothetical protein
MSASGTLRTSSRHRHRDARSPFARAAHLITTMEDGEVVTGDEPASDFSVMKTMRH